MSDNKDRILLKVAKEFNVGLSTITDFLGKKGFAVDAKPMSKITQDMYDSLLKEYQGDKVVREEANKINIGKIRLNEPQVIEKQTHDQPTSPQRSNEPEQDEILIKNINSSFAAPEPQKKEEPKPEEKPAPVKPREEGSLPGPKVVGKIDLNNLSGKKSEPAKEETAEQKPAPVTEEKPTAKEAVQPVAETAQPKAVEPETAKTPEKPVEKEAPVTAVVETPPAVEKTEEKATEQTAPAADLPEEVIRAKAERLSGPNIIGKITLPVDQGRRGNSPVASSSGSADQRRKRKRKENPQGGGQNQNRPQGSQPGTPGQQQGGPQGNRPGGFQNNRPGGNNGRPDFRNNKPGGAPRPAGGPKEEPTEKEIQDQIKATLARLSGAGKSGKFAQRAKLRRQKRDDYASSAEEAALEEQMQSRVLKVTEFVTANELASLIDVPVTQIISTCMSLGMFVSINQRLDAETLTIVAEEFGYEVQFVKPDDEETIIDEVDTPESLIPRAPIVTIMGHVDHGKTSLLDYIRSATVVAGEAGGITQHIGAYEVSLEDGRKITFLDTPGHEAFTAMRARGAKVTDIVIIVIAADDSVMPQTREAINHAQAAGVPLIFAFNKIDKPGANADKIREQLSAMNILVEDWGGKYQAQEISAKSGLNIDLLLEKVLLEAELLDLKANPNKRAVGTVIESALDKGRGIVTTVLVQSGTLSVGDPILAGSYSGRVKALFNERGQRTEKVGPSQPIQVLGMQGAPTAGDKFNAMDSEPEAREIATKRMQLQREQGLRTQKHITLDEIGRRLAIGNFRELNVIVKGDVDGSIEALSDSLLKLSTEEIQVNVISKAVGQISESDVLLASASDAIIIGFQVRPSASARKLAEAEEIDIRLYSIIYDAINEVKAAMEGMLAPEFEEKITANVEIRETFKITKVGTIAGCMVTEGKINRNSKIRIVRDGVVVYTGELASLKRFKDDVKEVAAGYECGLNIQNFNDIKVGDIVESYEQKEVKRKLA